MNENELNQLFDKLDVDGTGQIDINEFINASLEQKEALTNQHFKNLFIELDEDGSGTISKKEIKAVLGTGEGAEMIIEQFFKEDDEDSDGELNLEEFMSIMTNIQ